MIEVKSLTKFFGDFTAVSNVSFNVDVGEIVGFLGPNGAGKTTTMRMLTCYLPPSDGGATVDGFDIFRDSFEVRKRLGYLAENNPLYDDMIVEDYLNFVGRLRHFPRSQRKARINEMIDVCGLDEVYGKEIFELSNGFKRRVGLAQALFHDPEFLILDEPTAGLDPNQILEIRNLITRISEKKTIILSTHIMSEVQAICSRVLIISGGQIIKDSTPSLLVEEMSSKDVFYARIFGDTPGNIEAKLRAAKVVQDVVPDPKRNAEYFAGEIVIGISQDGTATSSAAKDLFQLIASNGWWASELVPAKATLEEVFRKLTVTEE
ncbi:MAG: ATP-binding cassette domain-containing protein [Planctomycetes bacterium]|nr:ATP-binding cassette domain-containing protein [Planctomycetota bacterium]